MKTHNLMPVNQPNLTGEGVLEFISVLSINLSLQDAMKTVAKYKRS